ncbi:MAG: hypothetical protein KIS80_09800 [Anaerolineales bacterium]|nr:hypothetical protein [Anaerolineales bacterium]
MSFRNFVITLLFLCVFYMGLNTPLDPDTWWHLRAGEAVLQTGTIPKTDSYSFTRAGEPWLYPSMAWLSQVQLYAVYSLLGLGGLNLWAAVLVTLAFAFIYKAMSGPPLLRAFVLVLAVTASGLYWAARPYMVSFVLSAAFLWILEDYRWKRANRLLWLPLLMAVWVNSHPGFAMGFLIVATYLFPQLLAWLVGLWRRQPDAETPRQLKQLGLLVLGLLLGACLNPSGPAMLAYPFQTVSIGVLQDHIIEWQSPNFHALNTLPFALLLFLTLGVVGASGLGLALTDFLLLAGFGYMSLLAARNIPAFALAAPLVLARHAEAGLARLARQFAWQPGPPITARWTRGLHLAVVLLGVLVIGLKAAEHFDEQTRAERLASNLPIGAVEYLHQQRPEGRLFNSYNWGGYLIWALPEYPVFTDGRTDLYGDELLTDWLDVVRADPGWQFLLESYAIDLILLEKHWPIVPLLPFYDWQVLYEDEISILYGR